MNHEDTKTQSGRGRNVLCLCAFVSLWFMTYVTGADWSSYGEGPEQIRYSSLRQINRENVRQLQVAWTYDTGETGGMQTQPIIVDDILYAYTPANGQLL